MKLKFVEEQDIPIFKLWWSDNEIRRLNLHLSPGNATEEFVRQRLFHGDRKYLIIEKSTRPIGYITMRKIEEDKFDVGAMIYDKEDRNKGYIQQIIRRFYKCLNRYELEAYSDSEAGKHLIKKYLEK